MRRTSCSRRCASCPTRCARCSTGGPRSPTSPSATRRRGATGRSSATAPTGSPRTRSGSSCRSSATSRSPATSPRTRSTSTSRPSRWSSCAPPGSPARTPTTSPRRSRSTGRTGRRRIVIATEGRAAFARRARDHRGARGAPARSTFVLVGDGRPPVRLRGRARDRRLGAARCARPGPRSRPVVADGRGADADLLERLAAHARAPAAPFFDGLRAGSLRRDPRGQHRGAARVAAALRDRGRCRSTRTRSSTARSARRAPSSRTSPPRSPQGIEELTRPVDAIKHQAKTVTVGISRSDETLLQVAARAGGARGRVRRATGSATARCARSSTSIPRSSEVTGFTRYRDRRRPRRRRAPRSTSSTRVASRPDLAVAHRRRSRACAAPSTGSRPNARSPWRAGAATGARSSSCPRSRTTQTDRSDAAARPLRTTSSRRRDAGACSRGTGVATPRCKDAVTETEPTFDDALLATIAVVDLLTEPVYVLADRWRTGDDWRAVECRARSGRDRRGRDRSRRGRPVPARARRGGPSLAERLFSDAEREYAFERHRTRRRASRRASAPRKR